MIYLALFLTFTLALLLGYFLAHRKFSTALDAARLDAASAKARLESEQKHAAEAMRLQAQSLRAEFKAISVETMRTQSDSLRTEHLNSLAALLSPLDKSIKDFYSQFISGKAALNSHIEDLMKQTNAIGREADELAKALRSNSKLQGNWGEMVLTNLLQATGLEKGRDYEVQVVTKDEEGNRFIPDVVVHLPDARELIIDSKVSLTAYTEYMACEDAEEQKLLLKNHVASVRKHIKELADKRYDKIVPGTIGYVLMFIPGEGAYVAAVNADPTLATEAYQQRVIIINPTNLLMALQLAHNLWQSELQSRSVKDIYASAERLYKKFTTFATNYVKIGKSLDQLQATYNEAEKQLNSGRGSIISQLESWKKKGLATHTQIPAGLLPEDEDETDENV